MVVSARVAARTLAAAVLVASACGWGSSVVRPAALNGPGAALARRGAPHLARTPPPRALAVCRDARHTPPPPHRRRMLARSVARRVWSVLLIRLCFAPAAALAAAGLRRVGLPSPAWARAALTLALALGASAAARSAPGVALRARCASAASRARAKFARKWRQNWRSYITIPLVAACTGWVTNRIAVWMIFYPISFKGLPLWRADGVPLGLLGWTGIVPAKTAAMASRMVDTLQKLVDVRLVFGRLSASRLAALLLPGVQAMVPGVVGAVVPGTARWVRRGALGAAHASFDGLPADVRAEVRGRTLSYIEGVVRDMQKNIDGLLDLRGLVVGEMVRDRTLLVELFQRVGRAELKFLVDSGFGFGFLLGLLQMAIWVLYDARWTLAAGGAIVGYLTNWIALKLIFEPVEPLSLFGGRWTFQGLFLTRQAEVSQEFSKCLVPVALTSAKLWENILHGQHASRFRALLTRHTARYVDSVATVLYGGAPARFAGEQHWAATRQQIVDQVASELPKQLHRVHAYTDEALQLTPTIATEMQALSSAEFEQVLHPIFQEDELTLIVVGGVLGLVVGYLQAVFTQPEPEALQAAAAPTAESGGGAAPSTGQPARGGELGDASAGSGASDGRVDEGVAPESPGPEASGETSSQSSSSSSSFARDRAADDSVSDEEEEEEEEQAADGRIG